MLDSAITFLVNEANGYLKRRTGTTLDTVEAGSIADDQGKWAVAEGRLRAALINIEEERVLCSQAPERVCLNVNQVMPQPGIKLNLVVLFAARLKNYDDSLRYLSHIITLFQARPSFTPDICPGLDPRIENLTLEMLPYGPEQLNQMWAYIGARYLPSVVYRVRMILLRDSEPQAIGKRIDTFTATLQDR